MILAPNHFANWDHFFAAVYLRRKVRFMAKSQLLAPTARSPSSSPTAGRSRCAAATSDQEAFITAHAILDRGGCMLMYAEGGRSRTGGLGEPRPGVGCLALESGVPVVPVAIHGSQGVRGWRRLQLPEGHDPVRRAADLRGRRAPLARAGSRRPPSEVFEPVREMYAALEEKGRRGVIKALREGIGARAERQVPAGQPR